MFFVWTAVSSVNALYAFAAIYGLFNAAVQGISMGGMSSLTKDLNKTGTRLGMALSILSFAALGGPPIAGALVDVNGGSFLYTQIFGGLVSMIGWGFLCVVRIKQVGFKMEKI
jgi:MFS family permease